MLNFIVVKRIRGGKPSCLLVPYDLSLVLVYQLFIIFHMLLQKINFKLMNIGTRGGKNSIAMIVHCTFYIRVKSLNFERAKFISRTRKYLKNI